VKKWRKKVRAVLNNHCYRSIFIGYIMGRPAVQAQRFSRRLRVMTRKDEQLPISKSKFSHLWQQLITR
jgi:hypothetical protein